MKLLIASDIHGSLYYAERMKELYQAEQADRLLLLGDLLYHGPRNDLPRDYNPKGVIALLNGMKNEILCVRGNCEAEVDQMVLEFPVMADYMTIFLPEYGGRMLFATHGHHFNAQTPPPLKKGDILLHGHTHIQAMEEVGDFLLLNPGSITLPKGGNVNSYMTFEDGVFTIKDLERNEISSISIGNS